MPHAQQALQLTLDLFDAGLIGLVDDENVGDLHDPGFERLDIVAHPRHQHHQRDRCQLRYSYFRLPHADRLDDHHVAARGGEEAREVGGRIR